MLAESWQIYEEAALAAGRNPNRADWKVSRSIFLADTTRRRKPVRTNSLGDNYEYIGKLFDRGLGRRCTSAI